MKERKKGKIERYRDKHREKKRERETERHTERERETERVRERKRDRDKERETERRMEIIRERERGFKISIKSQKAKTARFIHALHAYKPPRIIDSSSCWAVEKN